MWLRIRYVSACLYQGTDHWGFHQTFGNCWLAGQLSVSLKKALLHGAFRIFDDDWHDYVPIFRAAGTKFIISKLKVKRVRV
jgi:hypothetical protein